MSFEPPDYVRQVSEAKKLEAREYNAIKQYNNVYGWIQDEKL